MDLGRLLVSVFIVEAQQFIVDDDEITRSVELGEVKVSYLIQFATEYENPWSQVLKLNFREKKKIHFEIKNKIN